LEPDEQSTDMDPELVSDIKDMVGMVIDKCVATQNWEVNLCSLAAETCCAESAGTHS